MKPKSSGSPWNNMDSPPPVYLFLGLRGTRRRLLLADLIDGAFEEAEPVWVAHAWERPAAPADWTASATDTAHGTGTAHQTGAPEAAPPCPSGAYPSATSHDAAASQSNPLPEPGSPGLTALAQRAATTLVGFHDQAFPLPPEDAEALFIVPRGDTHPGDIIEAFHDWLRYHRLSLTRIITAVHCQHQVAHAETLTLWHRACVHFADVVLLTRRDGISPTDLQSFLAYFEKEHFPAPFFYVKKDRVPNPALILTPEPRRISLLFDEDLDAVDFLEIDEDNLPEEPIDLVRPPDPYLARDTAGHRAIRLPDVTPLLEPQELD